jgi:uncharacterized membrane protein
MSQQAMDYDPYVEHGGSQANVVQIESLGKGAWAILTASVLVSVIAIALAFRAEAKSTIAEREARVAQDTLTHFQIELAKKGIFIQVDDH